MCLCVSAHSATWPLGRPWLQPPHPPSCCSPTASRPRFLHRLLLGHAGAALRFSFRQCSTGRSFWNILIVPEHERWWVRDPVTSVSLILPECPPQSAPNRVNVPQLTHQTIPSRRLAGILVAVTHTCTSGGAHIFLQLWGHSCLLPSTVCWSCRKQMCGQTGKLKLIHRAGVTAHRDPGGNCFKARQGKDWGAPDPRPGGGLGRGHTCHIPLRAAQSQSTGNPEHRQGGWGRRKVGLQPPPWSCWAGPRLAFTPTCTWVWPWA